MASVGNLCKAMANRIREIVSSVTADDFRGNSAGIIEAAISGDDLEKLPFTSNNLVVTSVVLRGVKAVAEWEFRAPWGMPIPRTPSPQPSDLNDEDLKDLNPCTQDPRTQDPQSGLRILSPRM